jgi:hypothetical protein
VLCFNFYVSFALLTIRKIPHDNYEGGDHPTKAKEQDIAHIMTGYARAGFGGCFDDWLVWML